MTVIKINALTVPSGAGDELAHRFAARRRSRLTAKKASKASSCSGRPTGATSGS